jgi:hypothetical protein
MHLVTQPLLLQAGADPRPQQDRIERLGEIVVGARLDAADDRIELAQCPSSNLLNRLNRL